MPYYYPHAFRHFLNRYFCALCRHRFRVIIGGSCDHAGSPCLVSSSISSRKNSVCFFIVFRFSLKNYAVNLSFMVIEKNGKLPDTKAAQDTMLDLILPICETKDRQCMG